MKRPLMPVALLYGGGLLIADLFQPSLLSLFSFSLLLAAIAIFISHARKFLIGPLIVCVGWTNLAWRTAVISPHDLRVIATNSAEIVTIRGTLLETPGQRVFMRGEEESWHSLARVKVSALRRKDQWQPAFGKIIVTVPGILPEYFFKGQNVEVTGVLAPPSGPIAEGLFDWQSYLRRQEIYFQIKTEGSNDWKMVSPVKLTAPIADRFRVWAAKAIAIGIPVEDESLRLERALTLGDKTVLTDEVSEPFVRSATYHIFAVDGLRMAIIFLIFFSLFRVAGLPRVWCGVVLIPLIWFYTALTGWPASAIRATVMLTIIIVGWALKRPSDLINSLFTAALIILIWDPQQLFQAGFQLSFLVVLCMILTLPTFDALTQRLLKADPLLPEELRPRWQKILIIPARWTLDFLFTSTAAWLGSIPLAAYYFHIFTPISAPANLLAVPLCGFVLASNLISLLLAGWFPAAAEIFNHAGWFLMECIRVSSIWFAKWPAAYCYVAAPGLFGIALFYLILIAVFTGWLFKAKWRVWKFTSLAILTLIWVGLWLREYSTTRLTVFPLNGGSAVFADAPGNKNDLLIDCGNSNSVESVTKPFLRAQGVNKLSCAALTHGDLRHVGGIELLQSLFGIGRIVTGSARTHSPIYRRVLDELKQNPKLGGPVNRGENVGDWTVLHPDSEDRFSEADDNALVLFGIFDGARVLLLSDLGRAGQEALLNRTNNLRADIVVSCLPEKGEPLCDGLLDAIQPKFIIITDSESPGGKRPSAQLRERLEKRGVPVVFTRDSRAVTIFLRKQHWQIRTMSGLKFESSD
jgi:competence protein ComEC